MPEQPKTGSAEVLPQVKEGELTEIQKAELEAQKTEALKAAMRMEAAKVQGNVETSKDGNVFKMGIDEYDRWVKDFFELEAAPGYTPNYTREDFPDVKGQPLQVSRCYFNKHEGKFVVLDILDEDEYDESELYSIQATLRALGFHYTWTYQGEETTLEEIFNGRMMRSNKTKPQVKKQVQTNVVTVRA